MEILDRYVTSAPNIQNALDIFNGDWASSLPGYLQSLEAGENLLFQDPRIQWAIEQFGGIKGQRVLELGPLEAGHTYMLEKLGAASITAVEANTRAYLKCLIVKEIMGLTRAHFLCGDFVEYLRNCPEKFDSCFASGVLYHMMNPVELLSLMAGVSDKIFIWTHYYDGDRIASNPHNIAPKFTDSIAVERDGFHHTLYRYEYQTALDSSGFCGGSNPFSHWMSREDILSYLRYVGLTEIEINFETPDHPNGPCFALTAIRPSAINRVQIHSSEVDSIEVKLDKLAWELQQAKLEAKRSFQQEALTKNQLQKTQEEWERSQTQLQQTQTELENIKVELQQVQIHLNACHNERTEIRADLEQTHTRLHQTQIELAKAQSLLQQTQAEVNQTHIELGNTQAVAETTQTLLHQTRIELGNSQKELLAIKGAIAAMESSKFWKIRSQWFKFKKMLGLEKN